MRLPYVLWSNTPNCILITSQFSTLEKVTTKSFTLQTCLTNIIPYTKNNGTGYSNNAI